MVNGKAVTAGVTVGVIALLVVILVILPGGEPNVKGPDYGSEWAGYDDDTYLPCVCQPTLLLRLSNATTENYFSDPLVESYKSENWDEYFLRYRAMMDRVYEADSENSEGLCNCFENFDSGAAKWCSFDSACKLSESGGNFNVTEDGNVNEDFVFELQCQSACMMIGRPFRGGVVAEAITEASDWQSKNPSLTGEDSEELAEKWISAGLEEHASVASFADFTLSLLKFNAPARLVDWSLRSAREEINHAKLSFDLANMYRQNDSPASPGALDTSKKKDNVNCLEELLKSALVEGFFHEHANALIAQARRDSFAQVRIQNEQTDKILQTLTVISEDELQHANLAFETAKWILEENEEFVPLVEALISDLSQRWRLDFEDSTNYEVNHHTSFFPRSVEQNLRRQIIRNVIVPKALKLL